MVNHPEWTANPCLAVGTPQASGQKTRNQMWSCSAYNLNMLIVGRPAGSVGNLETF